jgi:hypothetical protein
MQEIEREENFNSLHGDPRFKQILADVKHRMQKDSP